LHQYPGIGAREHLSYLFTGIWSVMIGVGVTQGKALAPQIVRLRRCHEERQAD
jgi:hypothetical protein